MAAKAKLTRASARKKKSQEKWDSLCPVRLAGVSFMGGRYPYVKVMFEVARVVGGEIKDVIEDVNLSNNPENDASFSRMATVLGAAEAFFADLAWDAIKGHLENPRIG